MNVDSGTDDHNGRTSISVPKSLHQKLDEERNPGQSFNGYIRQLMEENQE
jgi:hypothetical protein